MTSENAKTRKRESSLSWPRAFVAACLFVAAPRVALACPVCFGDNNSPQAIAMNVGIFAMLLVVAGVLGGFASFIIYLVRRAKLVEQREGTTR